MDQEFDDPGLEQKFCCVQMKVQKCIIRWDFHGSTSLHKNKRSSAGTIHLRRRGRGRNKMRAEQTDGFLALDSTRLLTLSSPICLDLVHSCLRGNRNYLPGFSTRVSLSCTLRCPSQDPDTVRASKHTISAPRISGCLCSSKHTEKG